MSERLCLCEWTKLNNEKSNCEFARTVSEAMSIVKEFARKAPYYGAELISACEGVEYVAHFVEGETHSVDWFVGSTVRWVCLECFSWAWVSRGGVESECVDGSRRIEDSLQQVMLNNLLHWVYDIFTNSLIFKSSADRCEILSLFYF